MNHATQKVDGEPTVSEYHMDYCFLRRMKWDKG